MAVPKKLTSISKKRICKNIWKREGYWVASFFVIEISFNREFKKKKKKLQQEINK